MQVFKTLPTDKEFLRRYGKYYGLITLGIILSQIISGFTESGLIYSSAKEATLVFGVTIANISGIICAIVGVLLIEWVGIRVALTGAVDAFLYKRWKGLNRHFSIALIVLTVVLVPSSFIMSLKGGGQIVESLKEKTEQKRTGEIEAKESVELAQLDTIYTRNILAAKETYKELINSEIQKTASDSIVKKQNYDHWKSKGSRYKTKINNALVELQGVEAAKTARIAELKQQQATELKALQTRYDRDKAEIKNEANAEISAATGKIDTKSSAFKSGTKFIVLIAMFFAVGFTVMHRIYLKGSGIEELAEPSNFFFAPTLQSERLKLAQDRYHINRRNQIAERRKELPQLMPYTSQIPVHDLATLERTILELKMQQGEQRKVYYLDEDTQLITGSNEDLESRITSLVQAQIKAESENHHEAAKVVELQAKEVIKMYLQRNNQSTNDNEINAFQTKVINHLNEPKSFENPFDENGKRTIGFKQNGKDKNNAYDNRIYENRMEQKTDTKIVSQSNLRTCQNCGNTYQYKHHKQKYCKDECRIEFWENKNGRKLKKKPKK